MSSVNMPADVASRGQPSECAFDQPMLDLEATAGLLSPPAHYLPLKLDRALQIARHYRWSQMFRRGCKVLARRVSRSRRIQVHDSNETPKLRHDLSALAELGRTQIAWRRQSPAYRAADLDRGEIWLLNERRTLGNPIDWTFQGTQPASHLWRFQLHYHEFLLPLAANASPDTRQKIWQTIEHWISAHRPDQVGPDDEAWHPYCISRRLPTWVWLWTAIGGPSHSEIVLSSMRAQADYLADHLEFDPGGNHLLENLTALGLVASFVDHPHSQRWLTHSERHLRGQLARQILPHGEHFERSPMYHCHVLGNLLCLLHATKSIRQRESPQWLVDFTNRMIAFIAGILHPDGEIPLLGDSGFGESPSIVALRDLAKTSGVCWPDEAPAPAATPYWVRRSGKSAMILDGGAVGASELPAHAHADLGGLELSIEGNRWFVDSGNFNYEDDSMRRYCRSAVAHNLATVDDREPCDMWSKFRMGFRGNPLRLASGNRSGADWSLFRHDGYRRSHVHWMDRLVVGWGEMWLCADFGHASQPHGLTAYLHLRPGLEVRPLAERRFLISDHGVERQIEFFGVSQVELARGWFCPSFGVRQRNGCLVYRKSPEWTGSIGWLLDRVGSTARVEADGHRLFLRANSAVFEWSFE